MRGLVVAVAHPLTQHAALGVICSRTDCVGFTSSTTRSSNPPSSCAHDPEQRQPLGGVLEEASVPLLGGIEAIEVPNGHEVEDRRGDEDEAFAFERRDEERDVAWEGRARRGTGRRTRPTVRRVRRRPGRAIVRLGVRVRVPLARGTVRRNAIAEGPARTSFPTRKRLPMRCCTPGTLARGCGLGRGARGERPRVAHAPVHEADRVGPAADRAGFSARCRRRGSGPGCGARSTAARSSCCGSWWA